MAHPPARVSADRTPRELAEVVLSELAQRSLVFPGMEIANVFTEEWDDEQEHEGLSDD
jgi:hypothetical protein